MVVRERERERERESLDDKSILIKIIIKKEYEYINKIKGRIDNFF